MISLRRWVTRGRWRGHVLVVFALVAALVTGVVVEADSLAPEDLANAGGRVTQRAKGIFDGREYPKITWAAPSPIVYGMALGLHGELNASANVPGQFTYRPAYGTLLGGGTHTLIAEFAPSDTKKYRPHRAKTSLVVERSPQQVSFGEEFRQVRDFGSGSARVAIAVAPSGDLYVAQVSGLIERFAPSGQRMDPVRLSSALSAESRLAIDSAGTLLVTSPGRVTKFGADGAVRWHRDVRTGNGAAVPLRDIAVGRDDEIFVVSSVQVHKVASDGSLLSGWLLSQGGRAITTDPAGDVYVIAGDVTPGDPGYLAKFDRNGFPLPLEGRPGGVALAGYPTGGSVIGNVDYANRTYISMVSSDGRHRRSADGSTALLWSIPEAPRDIAVHSDGTVYVLDWRGSVTAYHDLPDLRIGTPNFGLKAGATSRLTVTFAASGQCTVSGKTVHLLSEGTCTITASQAGDANWLPAQPVTRSFKVLSR